MTRTAARGWVAMLLVVLGAPTDLRAQAAGGEPSAPSRFCRLDALADPTAQIPVGLDWTRSLDLLDGPGHSWLLKRGVRGTSFRDVCAGLEPADVRVLPVAISTYTNSGYAHRDLDGLVWQGKGLSTQFSAGVAARFGPVSLAVQPMAAFQQNKEFELKLIGAGTLSPYSTATRPGQIDMPERFGPDSYWSVSPGQSHVSLDLGSWVAGASTENQWWGPAVRSPVILGSGAPGYPHIFVGTREPVDVGFGKLELEIDWGVLEESDYFDDSTTNNKREFSTLALGLSPDFLPGFHLAFLRAYHLTLLNGHISPGSFLNDPFRSVGDNRKENQLVSFILRVAPPSSGFEAYIEWARDDWWSDYNDLLSEPEHSQGYTVGFQQAREVGDGVVRLYGELTHLGAATTFLTGRPTVTFYTHANARQGHTNEGQLLGAPMGPGSNGQMLGAGVLHETWEGGIELQHVTYDNDAYYYSYAPIYTFTRHDWEFTTLLNGGLDFGSVRAHAEAGVAYRRNRNFLNLTDVHSPARGEKNLRSTLQLEWRP